MNWGKGLAITMAIFMIFIVSIGIYSTRNAEGLIDDDYYEKGLDYNHKKVLYLKGEKVQVETNNDQLLVSYDSMGFVQLVSFKNVADAASDRKISKTDSVSVHNQEFTLAQLAGGRYLIDIEGVVNGKPFAKQFNYTKAP
ncbi:MAG: hypothetical protein ACI83I_002107 [Bacteroidia bacterium]|jgi:hypothetical protein